MNPLLALALASLFIAGCASRAPTPAVAPPPAPRIDPQQGHVQLGGQVSVDYQIERKISAVNGVSCYAFITGTLNNGSSQTLSRRTVIDFNFMHAGRQVFRDLTSPVADVPPGARAQFQMVVSPVHREGCIAYDPIQVSLRKVVAP